MARPDNNYQNLRDEKQEANDPANTCWPVGQLFLDVLCIVCCPISEVIEAEANAEGQQDEEVKETDREQDDERHSKELGHVHPLTIVDVHDAWHRVVVICAGITVICWLRLLS